MSEEYKRFEKARDKLKLAKNALKPNSEQIQAHALDAIIKARKALKVQRKFFEDRLKEFEEQE